MALKCYTRKNNAGANYVTCSGKKSKKKKKPVGETMRKARQVVKESKAAAAEAAKKKKVSFAPGTKAKDGGKKSKRTALGERMAELRRIKEQKNRERLRQARAQAAAKKK